MTHQLSQYEDVATKSAEKIMKDTGADGVAIIVVKDGDTIAALNMKNVVGAMAMFKATEKIQKAIADDVAKKLEEAGPCQCEKCQAKRAEFAA